MKFILKLLLLSFFAFSCNTKKNLVEVSSQNTSRIWMLVEFKDYKKDYLIEKKAFLDLTNKERASSKMGCNNLSFPYLIKNTSIQFFEGISTEMLCKDLKLEDDFSKIITTMTSFTINAHRLTLTSSSGQKMVFIAQDWD